MTYKWCVVPHCTNTSIKTQGKVFISVPTNVKIRRKWLELARRNPQDIGANSNVFFCEDHFEMKKDVANYMQYKMGFSKKIRLTDGALPSKFDCQQDRKKRQCDPSTSRAAFVKRQRKDLVKQCEQESLLSEEKGESCVQKDDNVTILKWKPKPEKDMTNNKKRKNTKSQHEAPHNQKLAKTTDAPDSQEIAINHAEEIKMEIIDEPLCSTSEIKLEMYDDIENCTENQWKSDEYCNPSISNFVQVKTAKPEENKHNLDEVNPVSFEFVVVTMESS